jgi:hypothetical protein
MAYSKGKVKSNLILHTNKTVLCTSLRILSLSLSLSVTYYESCGKIAGVALPQSVLIEPTNTSKLSNKWRWVFCTLRHGVPYCQSSWPWGLYDTSNTPINHTFCTDSKLIGLQLAHQRTSRCYTVQTSTKHTVLLLADLFRHLLMYKEKFGPIFRTWNGRQPEVQIHRPEDAEVSDRREILLFTFVHIWVYFLFSSLYI